MYDPQSCKETLKSNLRNEATAAVWWHVSALLYTLKNVGAPFILPELSRLANEQTWEQALQFLPNPPPFF